MKWGQSLRYRAVALSFCAVTALAALTIAASRLTAAEGDRAARLASFVRPKAVPFPADNPYSEDKAALGQLLFFDPLLSASGTISCATCHHPRLAWGDGLPRAIGEARTSLPFRSPTLLGSAWLTAFGWDGKFPTLESVAFTPMTSPANMGRTEAEVLRDVQASADYRAAFAKVFPNQGVTRLTMEQALATYERTIVPAPAPFDRWAAGDESAVNDAAKRGFDLFTGKASCTQCHSTWRFTDDSFHDIGTGGIADVGRGRLFPTSQALQFAFKTPTLRDVARRSPFMHDGSLPTLAAVIDLYDRGGVDRPSRDAHIHALNLSADEKADLVAFLQTLSGDAPRDAAATYQ